MISSYNRQVIDVFKLHEEPVNAASMAKYMKDKFAYFGINSPIRKEISKPLLQRNVIPKIDDIPTIVKELWDLPQRELQYFALDLVQKYARQSPREWIDLYAELITLKPWWDSVDGLSANQVGGHFKKFPDQIEFHTSKWMNSGNIWLQRTCLIFQLKYKDDTDFELMKSFITPLSGSSEFFVRKAIGWALRQYGKFNPEAVLAFVNTHQLSHLSRREALKHIG